MSDSQRNNPLDESRRIVLLGMGAFAAANYSGMASSAMKGHDHSKHKPQFHGVLDATNDCVDKVSDVSLTAWYHLLKVIPSWQSVQARFTRCARSVMLSHIYWHLIPAIPVSTLQSV